MCMDYSHQNKLGKYHKIPHVIQTHNFVRIQSRKIETARNRASGTGGGKLNDSFHVNSGSESTRPRAEAAGGPVSSHTFRPAKKAGSSALLFPRLNVVALLKNGHE